MSVETGNIHAKLIIVFNNNQMMRGPKQVSKCFTIHQQGSKSADSGHTQNLLSATLTKGMTSLDEFKYGLPSDHLSTTSNKWWGNIDTEDRAGINPDGAKVVERGKCQVST